MRSFIKKILFKPSVFISRIIIGLYLYINKNKAYNLKEFDFTDDRILVLSPHQDDEVLGCGCLIKQSVDKGNKVKCVFFTDGSKSLSTADPVELKNIRKAEAIEVAKLLAMDEPIFLDKEDGSLDHNDREAAIRVADIIKEFNPGIIMAPYFLDGHKDHSAVSGILINALELIKYDGKLFAYEINSPITVYGITHYVDCSELSGFKEKTLKTYKSQTMSFESILLMEELNGILAGTKEGAELFRELNYFSYKKAYNKYNEDNNIWIRFKQMYSIYFMIIAYFKGIGLKKEIAMLQNIELEQIKKEDDIEKSMYI